MSLLRGLLPQPHVKQKAPRPLPLTLLPFLIYPCGTCLHRNSSIPLPVAHLPSAVSVPGGQRLVRATPTPGPRPVPGTEQSSVNMGSVGDWWPAGLSSLQFHELYYEDALLRKEETGRESPARPWGQTGSGLWSLCLGNGVSSFQGAKVGMKHNTVCQQPGASVFPFTPMPGVPRSTEGAP